MKRISSVIILILLVSIVSGCSQSSQPTSPEVGLTKDSEALEVLPKVEEPLVEEPKEEPIPSNSVAIEKIEIPPEDVLKPLIIKEAAAGISDDNWWYVVILDNPNVDKLITGVQLTVEAISDSNVLLDSSNNYVDIISGVVVLTGKFYSIGDDTISNLNILGLELDKGWIDVSNITGDITISEMKVKADTMTTVSGNATSSLSQDFDSAMVNIIVRNSEDEIIRGDYSYMDRLPAGGITKFTVDFWTYKNNFPDGTTFEAYVRPN